MAVSCSCNELNRSRELMSSLLGGSVSITCPICCPPEDNVDWLAVQLAIESKDGLLALLMLLEQTEPYHRVSWADSATSQNQLDHDVDAIKDGI